MRLLVTGAAGFIGGNYVLSRTERYPGDEIVSLDKLTYAGNLENLEAVYGGPNHTFVRGDINDAALLGELFNESIDVVVNFAAESHVDRSIAEPSEFLNTNTLGTLALLEAFRTRGGGLFIQISTDEVYGSLGDDDPSFTETTPLDPSSPYSASKASADLLAMSYHRTYGAPVIVTRCSNNYGPYQFPEKMIPLFINNLLRGEPAPIYGEGKNIRDWIFVRDHCAAIDKVIDAGRPGEIYNIGGNCEKRNIDVVDSLLAILEKPPSLKKFVTDRPGHDYRYSIDCSKIERELGWRPETDFDTGLKLTVDWYLEHADWLERVTSGSYREYYEKTYGNR